MKNRICRAESGSATGPYGMVRTVVVRISRHHWSTGINHSVSIPYLRDVAGSGCVILVRDTVAVGGSPRRIEMWIGPSSQSAETELR